LPGTSGLLERKQPLAREVTVQHDYDEILARMPAHVLSGCLRAVDRERLYSALKQLADEEDETDAARAAGPPTRGEHTR
jgi:hypothetical protein